MKSRHWPEAKYWWLASLLAVVPATAQAQRADGIYHIACMVQMKDADNGGKIAECTTHPRADGKIGIGGRVGFDVTTTHELMDQEGAPEVTELVLFIDGQPLPGTHPIVESQTDEPLPAGANDEQTDSVVTFRVVFPITRDLSTDKGKESWKKLLGGLRKNEKEVPVSVGLVNGPPLPSTYKSEFIRLGGGRLILFIVVAIVVGIGFLIAAKTTGALRDKEPPPPGNLAMTAMERPYSLSRMQIALWTLLVVYAYLFIWIITGEYNTVIPGAILAILGISAGTYATAATIDHDKAVNKGVTVTQKGNLAEDLFSTSGGASLHRVQFGLWSVVLMVVFVITVWETLAMPQFDTSLLGLMGISSAAYAGMKISEKKQ